MRRRRPRYDVPDTVRRQLKRRRWTRRGVFAALLLLALSTFLDRVGVFGHRGDDWANFDRQAVTVTHVVDGDTVRVRRSPAAAEETIRLLGIDAPEVGHGGGEASAHWGDAAGAHLERLVEGKPVTVRLDATQTRDRYRRLLAYLYAGDGAENLNLSLVRDGHAYAHRVFPHSMRRQFEQAEDDARDKGRGLWAGVREDQMPAWRQRWLAERRGGRGPAR